MIIPDIIISWPRNCDYPLWRQYIRDNRTRFNEVIIIFTETHFGEDYRDFVTHAMQPDHVLTVWDYQRDGREDWRNQAIHAGLIHSYNAQWILFTEQDFLPKIGFWQNVQADEGMGVRAIGVKDNERLHPCCLFLRRDLLNSLSKDFGVVKDKLDHFGLIQKQLESSNEPIGILNPDTYFHNNGLSHNMSLVERGEMPNYHPTEFTQYLVDSLNCTVPKDKRWLDMFGSYLGKVNVQE
jgi:hypothetical protein